MNQKRWSLLIIIFQIILIFIVFFGFYFSSNEFRFNLKNIGLRVEDQKVGEIHFKCTGGNMVGYGGSIYNRKNYRFGILIKEELISSEPPYPNLCKCDYITIPELKDISCDDIKIPE